MKKDVRLCRNCGKKISGRSDKKHCSSACRSAWNNEQRFFPEPALKLVNRILKRNRNVLIGILPAGARTIRASKIHLEAIGFNFSYFTGACKRKNGLVFFFCYEFGYIPLDNDWYYIVRRGSG